MSNSIWCVGRNYKEHAKEMGAEIPSSPLIFLKSFSSINSSQLIKLPSFSQHIEHEIEVAIKINENLEPAFIALALDLTARDIQKTLKENGHPWTLAKSFKGSCLLSQWIPFKSKSWFENLNFQLTINNEVKQSGQTSNMIFKISELLNYLQCHYSLTPNDIILTGTPKGVGKLNKGDKLYAEIKGELQWTLEVEKNSTV